MPTRVYWVINLVKGQLEVYINLHNPRGRGRHTDYQEQLIFRRGEAVPVIVDGQEIGRLTVQELLP